MPDQFKPRRERPEIPPPLDLTPREIEALWEKLADEASTAYEALNTLRRAPGQVVPYLRARLTWPRSRHAAPWKSSPAASKKPN